MKTVKIQILLLAAIVGFGAVLRLAKLDQWNFWIDELFTVRDALSHSQLLIYDVFQVQNPAEYPFNFTSVSLTIVRGMLLLFGIHEWSARITAVVFGVLSLLLVFWIARRLFDWRVALFATLFMAISPWHLFLSQNARYYTPLIFFFLLSFYFFYLSLEKNNFFYLAGSIFFMGLAVLERVHALFFAPVILLYLGLLLALPFEKPAGLTWKRMILILALPATVYLLYEAYQVFVLHDPSFLSIFLSPTFLGLTTSRPRWLLTGLITDLGMPLVILGATGAYFLLRERSRIGLLLVLNSVVPLLVLMAMAPYFQTFNHYVMISLPSWVMLGAVGLVRLYERAASQRGAAQIGGVLGMIFLLFLADRVVRDIVHYFRPGPGAIALLLVGLLGAGLAVYRLPVRKCPGDWLWLGLLLVTLAHPLAANSLYYNAQHAYRDNLWKWAMQVVRAEKAPGDVVISVMSPVASYYLGEKAEDLDQTDPEVFLQDGKRVWITDVFGVYRSREKDYGAWVEQNCTLVDSKGRYLRGETVITHVQLCSR